MTIKVFVEIPKGSKNKYELDKKTNQIVLDRTLYGSQVFPFEYGFIEGTLGEDGDPLDVVLLASNPSFPGCVVEAEPVGYLQMEDESGIDHKVIAIPTKKIDPRWSHIKDVADIPEAQKAEIKNFFETYKLLEPGKWVKVKDFKTKAEAEKLIEKAQANAHS